MNINVAVTDANNIVCEVTPTPTQLVTIDRGVVGNGIVSISVVLIDGDEYLHIVFTNGTTSDVGPISATYYTGTTPIVVNNTTNVISLDVVPVTLGGTNATTASGARTNLAAAYTGTTISAGTGLSGGGDLSANRTLAIANTGVTAASYGSASKTLTATVNAQGQLTALADTNIAIANTQVSGLGTASTRNAGVANGVATLDAGGTVPLSQIPASIQGGVSYQGAWNASTNTPTLTSSVGSKGYYYVVSVAGSTNLNGVTDWNVGDWAIFNGTIWQKIDNTDAVTSVNGYTGTVVLTNTDVGAPPTSLTITAGTGLSGGGSLAANRTLSIANTTVTANPYGSASAVPTFTVNAQGQLTAASNTTIAIANTQVSGLGTMSTQNANSVAITGGSITGITDLAIADGGTGASTANAAFNALAPSQTGNTGKYLTTNGTDTSWATNPLGTVTSVDVSGGTTGLTTSGGPITTSGTITLAGTLAIGNGGTGQTTAAAAITALSGTQTSGYYLRSNGTNTALAAIVAGDVPTLNQNTTGTAANITASSNATLTTLSSLSLAGSQVTGNISGNAANVTGTVAIANGGTGQTTANAAFNALVPSQTSQSGKYLTTNGTDTSWATNPLGTVTSVGGTGTVSGISLSGTVTTSGNLTLGGTLNLSSPPAIGNTAPSTGNFTTLTENSVAVVTQSDIGSAPNEIPLNQYLGSLAYQNGDAYYNTGMTVGFRNRIINGAMMIDQRNNGAVVNSGGFVWSVDRWNTYEAASGAFSVQRSTVAPTGFTNSLLFTVTTAQSSLGAGDQYIFWQPIEGNNIADLAWGTANAQIVTVSFWVRSSVTGTFPVTLISDGTDTCVKTFKVLNANTWEYKTINFSGATAGTWRTGTDLGMYVRFVLGAGSNYFATEGQWNYSSYNITTSSCTNLMATSGATFQVTGVQLEKGNIATSFDVRPFTTELQLCQRYYSKLELTKTLVYATTTTYAQGNYKLPVTMRAAPTSVGTNATLMNELYVANISGTYVPSSSCDTDSVWLIATNTAGTAFTANRQYRFNTAGCSLDFSAEL